ncbi:MAG: type II toxin-antitoxin system HicB family antitoxin [Magnetococcus sp. DMHC-8]
MQFFYPVVVRQKNDTAFQAALPDFPEIGSGGATLAEALTTVTAALAASVADRIRHDRPIPQPSLPRGRHHHWAVLPALLSAKTALYLTMRQSGISKVALARRLNHDEKEVRRLLDPGHPSKLPRIETALAALGVRLVVSMTPQG